MGVAIYDELLPVKKQTLQIAARVKLPPDHVAGLLMRVWCWASSLTDDSGHLEGLDFGSVDGVLGIAGFASAMGATKPRPWLIAENGGITFPDFDTYNWKTFKERKQAAERQAKASWKKRNGSVSKGVSGGVSDGATSSVSGAQANRDTHDANKNKNKNKNKNSEWRSDPLSPSEPLTNSDGEIGTELSAQSRKIGSGRDKAFAQGLVLRLMDAFQLDGVTGARQVKPFLAVARRIIPLGDRKEAADSLVALAQEKKADGSILNAVAAWQQRVNRIYPATRNQS